MTNQEAQPPPPVQPPPPLTFSPPVQNSYQSARQKELDAVRRKGLAKIFNKHFTTVATKIQHERAAAELALAELERRKAELKANPKSFSGGMTLTQLEKLYMELKRRKSEVFRRERETQELYKRYVSQYGSDEGRDKNTQTSLPVLHEDGLHDTVWQSDLMLAKSTDKKEATKDSDVGKIADQYINECSNAIQSQGYTPSKIGKVSLEKHITSETPHDPIIAPTTTYRSPNYSAKSPEVKKLSSSGTKQRKPCDSPAPTSVTSGGSSSENVPQGREANKVEKSPSVVVSLNGEKSPSVVVSLQGEASNNSDSLLGNVMVTTKSSNKLDDCDDSSTMSGLTTIDGATVVEAEWRLTEFLRIETENIRKMFAEEEANNENDIEINDLVSDNSTPSIIVGEVSQAAKKAEEMVRQMEAATAWMQDPTLLDSDSEDDAEDDEEDDDSVADDLEWKCFWSEEHDREYYFNAETGQTCWTKPQGVTIDYSSMEKNNRLYESEDCDDLNSIASGMLDNDADSVTVKDYTKSRRILVDTQALNPTEFTNEEMIDVFRPDNDAISISSRGSVRQSSKVLQYRRKRAKNKKIKRRLQFAFGLVVATSIYYYFQKGKVESYLGNSDVKTFQETPDFQSTKVTSNEVEEAKKDQTRNDKQSNNNELSNLKKLGKEESHLITPGIDKIQVESGRKDIEEFEVTAERQGSYSKEATQQIEVNNEQEEVKQQIEVNTKQEEVKQQIEVNTEQEEVKQQIEVNTEQEEVKQQIEVNTEQEEVKQQIEVSTISKEEREVEAPLVAELVQKEEKSLKSEVNHQKLETPSQVTQFAPEENTSTMEDLSTTLEEQSQIDSLDSDEMQVDNSTKEISRPISCAIPFAYIPSKKCRNLATKQPIYDCKALTDSMME